MLRRRLPYLITVAAAAGSVVFALIGQNWFALAAWLIAVLWTYNAYSWQRLAEARPVVVETTEVTLPADIDEREVVNRVADLIADKTDGGRAA